MSTAFKPITREAAAELLSVSLRAIDYYIERGLLPAPISLGGRRRYWHPDVFYAHLDAILHAGDSAANAGTTTPQHSDRIVAAHPESASHRQRAPKSNDIAKARAHAAERLARVNSE